MILSNKKTQCNVSMILLKKKEKKNIENHLLLSSLCEIVLCVCKCLDVFPFTG